MDKTGFKAVLSTDSDFCRTNDGELIKSKTLCPVAEPADAPDTSIHVFGNIRIISELENVALPIAPAAIYNSLLMSG